MSESDDRQGVVLIAGPTASGKSALATDLAKASDGVVINADSMQVYRDLAILTARPTVEDMGAVPHRLYGTLPGDQVCSAGRWRELALAEAGRALASGKLPILVGGTGLYLRAFEKGLSAVPEIPAAVRAETRDLLAEIGAVALHARLAEADPVMAERLAPGDGQRVARAWEVVTATGASLAEWQAREGEAAPYRCIKVCLLPEREALYAACDRRLEAMIDQGALEEVRTLLARSLDPGLPVMKALGVPELAAHLRGERSLPDALAQAQQATRRYAKRQMTWLRHQFLGNDPTVITLNAQYSESLKPKLFAKIRQMLLTGTG
ncbi:tRNA (adenosine(37)-N6)-dimethylallyltransferase MiaA [Pelagibius sp.]|uniref:tRNA (adenosine(37)-N6)-dimethylallyltransferase MiaA n=1 Tax=Pelagibius sp. TaxID=1931238 RepID=UPI002630CC51|nr:tRNA (adenosine(37)-N6)-dimethylallyltransferase MiaA [Pelagibius sp.]